MDNNDMFYYLGIAQNFIGETNGQLQYRRNQINYTVSFY